MIFQKWGNMKFAYRNREFWCTGYYVDTVGKNTQAIKEYIEKQLKADKEADQLSILIHKPLLRVASKGSTLSGVLKRHLCPAGSIKAIPENEIPLALPVYIYCANF